MPRLVAVVCSKLRPETGLIEQRGYTCVVEASLRDRGMEVQLHPLRRGRGSRGSETSRRGAFDRSISKC